MHTILGIDAAWTASEPSGVALVSKSSGAWRCVAVAPSYAEFLAQAEQENTDWNQKSFPGAVPDVPRLLRAARHLAGTEVDLVAIDMPIAQTPFSSRRAADNAISKEFGARWCSAHTPNSARPGPMGERLSNEFRAAGYSLATATPAKPAGKTFIEVYPHPALLSLLKRKQRVPYKVSKSAKYWPSLDTRGRISALLQEFSAIHSALAEAMGPLPFQLPDADQVTTLSTLKRYEDGLDALICAWVGAEYVSDKTEALGDDSAAIWCPRNVIFGAH